MSRLTAVAAAVLAAALMAPSTSLAGGFATVGIDSFPEDVQPGDEWVVELTVLQHGVTPLTGVKPRVMVEPAGTGEPEAFGAEPTERPGVYRASVEFESAGDWRISVDDDFAAVHEFGTVHVGNADRDGDAVVAGATGSAPSLGAALGIASLAGLLAVAFYAMRRRRQGPSAAGG